MSSIPGAAAGDAAGAPAVSAPVAPAATAAVPAAAVPASAGTATARVELAPGSDEDKKDEKHFPLSANISLDNSVGEGVFGTYGSGTDVLINGGSSSVHYAPAPLQLQWGTSLSLGGSASIPKSDWGLPAIGLSTGMSIAVANWLPSSSNGTVYERELLLSDINFGASMGNLFTEEITGIKVSGGIGTRLPISLHSRQTHLLLPLGIHFGFGRSWDTPIGKFNASYGPSFGFNLYTDPYSTIPGEGGVTAGNGVPTDPLANLGSIPVAYCRSTEALSATGECALGGRQGIASFSNSLHGGWSKGNHSVSVGIGYSVGFLRPLRADPSLSSQNATGQSFSESTNGSISYTYEVPQTVVDGLSLTAGLSSGQPAFDGENNFNFPFWNFWYPNSNTSSAFFDVSVGI